MNEKNEQSQVTLQSFSDAITDLVEKVAPSVVSVISQNGRSFGSGVVWSEKGDVVTNNHVVYRSDRAEVRLADGNTSEAKLIGRDPYTDLALLKMEEGVSRLVPIQRGNSEELKVGQFVLALANPFGEQASITSGIITSTNRSIGGWRSRFMENIVVSDAKVNPGYSGGPLVDAQGRMVALNTATAFSRALSIPVNTVKSVVENLARDGRIKTARLGVSLVAVRLPDEIAESPGIEQEEGLMVISVAPTSPARAAGLAMGDILVRFNGKPVRNHYDLRRLLGEDVAGKLLKVLVFRVDRLLEVNITPEESE